VLSPEFSTKFRELSIGFVAFDISFVHREDNEAAHRCASMPSETNPFFLGPAFSQIGLWRLLVLVEIVMIPQLNKSSRDLPQKEVIPVIVT